MLAGTHYECLVLMVDVGKQIHCVPQTNTGVLVSKYAVLACTHYRYRIYAFFLVSFEHKWNSFERKGIPLRKVTRPVSGKWCIANT